MRMAANGGRFFARAAVLNPWLMAAMIAAPIAYDWFQQGGFQWGGDTNGWQKKDPSVCTVSPCYQYSYIYPDMPRIWSNTVQEAFDAYAAFVATKGHTADRLDCNPWTGSAPQCTFYFDGSKVWNSPSTMSVPPSSVVWLPATPAEIEEAMAPRPVSPELQNEQKGFPWPVGDPYLLPGPEPALAPVPLRVPMGSPVPRPGTSPQEWSQPVADIIPRPLPDAPWRVEVVPKEIITNSPDGLTAPVPVPTSDPNNPPANEKPQDQRDLCADHPDILACAKLGEAPDAEKMKTQDVAITVTEDSGWSFGSSACPAPKNITAGGKTFAVSLQGFCDFASGVRPVIVGMAYLSAALILFGFARKGTS